MRIEPTENVISVSGGRTAALRLMIGEQVTAAITKVAGPSRVMLNIRGSQLAADLQGIDAGSSVKEGEAIALKVEGMTPEGILRMSVVEEMVGPAVSDVARRETDPRSRAAEAFSRELQKWLPDGLSPDRRAVIEEFLAGHALNDETAVTLARLTALQFPVSETLLNALHAYFNKGTLASKLARLMEILRQKEYAVTDSPLASSESQALVPLARKLAQILAVASKMPKYEDVQTVFRLLGFPYDREVTSSMMKAMGLSPEADPSFPNTKSEALSVGTSSGQEGIADEKPLKQLLLESLSRTKGARDPILHHALQETLDVLTGQQLVSHIDQSFVSYRCIPIFFVSQGVLCQADIHVKYQPEDRTVWNPDTFLVVVRTSFPSLGSVEATIQAIGRRISIVILAAHDLTSLFTTKMVGAVREACRARGYSLSGMRTEVRNILADDLPSAVLSMVTAHLDVRG